MTFAKGLPVRYTVCSPKQGCGLRAGQYEFLCATNEEAEACGSPS